MKRFPLATAVLVFTIYAYGQDNIVRNGDFSYISSDWVTSGDFNYYYCTAYSCDNGNPYAYTSPNCSNTDNASGTLYQQIVIPSNCTGGTFVFSHRTGTTNTFFVGDLLIAYLIANGDTRQVYQLTNLDYSPDQCTQISPVDVTDFLVQHKGEPVTLEFISTQTVDLYETAFRIDDVQLNITTSGGGNCVTWLNGQPQDLNALYAADYLCQLKIINSIQDASILGNFPLDNAALYTLSSLYDGLNYIPEKLPSDHFPSMIIDINTSNYPQPVNAMYFLEYGDGVSCIDRSFFSARPPEGMSLGDILRLLLEAYYIPPDNYGYDPLNHKSSNFFCNIYTDDFNYGYFQRAYEIGLLDDYYSGCTFQSEEAPGEFFLVMLQRVYDNYRYQHPSLTADAFYLPNNFKAENASGTADITKAAFETYEKDGFNIPSSGLGLHFSYSYHSDLTDMPLLDKELPTGRGMEFVKQRFFPLGIGWTYSYNIYIQAISDAYGADSYLAIRWGDGRVDMFDVQANQYETRGVYNSVAISEITNGKVQALSIKTKDQHIYQFKRNGAILELESMTDRNGNYLSFSYEESECAKSGYGVYGSYNRLSRVTDYFGSRYIQFNYLDGADLLSSVNDNTGRTITFNVDKLNLNLNSETNPRNLTTVYRYCYGLACDHLLFGIQRPRGNVITNEYNHRKLESTSTPEYKATIDFTPSYTSSDLTVQTTVSVSPLSGTSYTTSYNYGDGYILSKMTSKNSNIEVEYSDANNPSLPTKITQVHNNLSEVFEYDANGNIKKHSLQGANGEHQEEYFTYNDANEVLTHTLKNGSIFSYTYDDNHNLIEETGPVGYHKAYTRDNLRRITSVFDGTETVAIGYNPYGNTNSVSVSGTQITQSAQYDELSRVTDITDANKATTHYTYDPNDNITSIVQDANNLALTTRYQYDKNDNVVSITDPNNNTTDLHYNNSDDVEREASGNLYRSWYYNSDGTLQQYENKNHQLFDYTYYPEGDPNEGLIETDGYRHYSYDEATNVLERVELLSNTLVNLHYDYDELQRLNAVAFSSSDFSSSSSYEFDNSNNVTKISIPKWDKSFQYSYDELNRVTEVKDWNNNSFVLYTYISSGLLQTELLGNGVTVHYHYDGAERLDSIWSTKSDGTILHAIGSTADNNGNHVRESVYVNWQGRKYFNNLWDANTYEYDENNHLTQLSGIDVSSDNNGNMLSNQFTGMRSVSYNADDNLQGCVLDGKTKIFNYDPVGNRYQDEHTFYDVDYAHNANVLATEQDGALQQLYAHSPYGLICNIDPNTNARTYYLYDFRGSTVALVDDNQNIIQYYKYDPFGEITESSDSAKTATQFLFVGKYGVVYETPHLYYMRARYYDPTIGRFFSEDKKWTTNLFQYAGSNPLSNIDPQGLSLIPYWNAQGSIDFGLQVEGEVEGIGIGFDYLSVNLLRGSIAQYKNDLQPLATSSYYFLKNGTIEYNQRYALGIASETSYADNGSVCLPGSYSRSYTIGPLKISNESISLNYSLDLALLLGLHFNIEVGFK